MMRRSKLEIFCDILTSANSGATKTRIVYSANLTFLRTEKHLTILEELGLIERRGDCWVTTEKGREFIKDFSQLKNTLYHSPNSRLKQIHVKTVL